MFQLAPSENANYHRYRPMTSDTWCQYNRDQLYKTNFYQQGPGLSVDVISAIKPTYSD